jgi:hypothetical protein
MLRTIGFTMLCAAAALITNAHAVENHNLQAGITMEYELPANDPQLFTNYMFWTIEANCTLTTEDESNELYVEAVKKKGKVNESSLSQGETMSLIVHNNEVLRLSADSGAQVRITNLGEHIVKAKCSS